MNNPQCRVVAARGRLLWLYRGGRGGHQRRVAVVGVVQLDFLKGLLGLDCAKATSQRTVLRG
jgi:hypothetical protein